MKRLSAAIAGALALLVVVGIEAGPAPGAFPGTNGKIAFTSGTSDYEVFVMDADGSGVTQLTQGSSLVRHIQPAWSPDGGRIAFTTEYACQLYCPTSVTVMDADGSNVNAIAYGSQPAWSPDGSKLVFTAAPVDRSSLPGIHVMNSDGTGETALGTDARDFDPVWSPDGTRIAFTSERDGNYEIYVMNADGSGQARLTSDAAHDWQPDWSPDGTRIAFTSVRDGDYDVYVMDADGGNVTKLTTDPADDYQPAWSPDGTQIAFTTNRDDGNYDVYVMNADGSGQTRLTTDAGVDQAPDWQPVATPESQVEALQTTIEAMNLDPGVANSLGSKLEGVQASIAAGAGNRQDSCNKLNAFGHAVRAQTGKALTADQAAVLLDHAGRVARTIGCTT